MTIKKMAATAATAAVMMGSLAVPAMAQEQQYGTTQYAPQGQAALQEQQQAQQGRAVSVTGVVKRLPSDGGPAPYGITDEASGVLYVLDGGQGGFSAYEGRRVTATGTARDTGASYGSLSVSDIRAAQDGAGDTGGTTAPSSSAEPTVSFELKTDCKPPAGAKLFAGASQQTVALTDPDGDGTYTGSLTLPEGFYSSDGPFPVDVAILEGTPEDPNHVIKDFGEVVLKDGDHFSASASFCGGGTAVGTTGGGGSGSGTGGGTTVVGGGTNDADRGGGSVRYGQEKQEATAPSSETTATPAAAASGTEKTNENTAAVSGDTNASKGGGSVSASGGSVQGVVSSAAKALPSSVAKALPSTGGPALPIAGAAGALLLAGGLLVRRIFR